MPGPLDARETTFRRDKSIPDAFYDEMNALIMKYGVEDVARVPRHAYDAIVTGHRIPIGKQHGIQKAYEKAGWSVEYTTAQSGMNEYAYEVVFTKPAPRPEPVDERLS